MSRLELEQHEAVMRMTSEMRKANLSVPERSLYQPNKVEILDQNSLDYKEWLKIFEEDQVQFDLCK